MKKVLLILLFCVFVFGKDFKMKDGTIISIINTNYGIIVDDKYKLKFTHTEDIINGDYASIYQNEYFKYSISCEGSFCDVVITDKRINKDVNYGIDVF